MECPAKPVLPTPDKPGDIWECLISGTEEAALLKDCGWDCYKAKGGLYNKYDTWLITRKLD